MTYKTCLYYTGQDNGWCYYMNHMKTKRTDGVVCQKIYTKRKLCPYHPTYKEKKDASTKR